MYGRASEESTLTYGVCLLCVMLYLPANRLLGVVIAPLTEYGVDGSSYAKFQCSALLDGKEDNTAPITVTWVTHPVRLFESPDTIPGCALYYGKQTVMSLSMICRRLCSPTSLNNRFLHVKSKRTSVTTCQNYVCQAHPLSIDSA